MGQSIKYVTLFLANFDPRFTLCHTSRDPQKYVTHLGHPPIFSRPSTKNPDKSPCTNSLSIVDGGFCPGVLSFVWKVLSGVLLSFPPSVRMHVLQK